MTGDSLQWYDAMEWDVEGRGWAETKRRFDRLPARAEGVVRDAVWDLSRTSAGLSVRFRSNARQIHVRYDLFSDTLSTPHIAGTGHSGVDLYATSAAGPLRWVGISRPASQHVEAALAEGLAPGTRDYTLYLPLRNSPASLTIGVDADATIEALPARHERPLLFYGTSIMHGACASRAGMAISALVGRRLDRPTINLGFAGNGKMEPEIAALLAELDPCVFCIDCLPNMSSEEITEHAAPLVRTIRAARPSTPVLLVEDRTYANTAFFPAKAQRHRTSRQALRAAWRELQAEGMTDVHYLEGDRLLPDDGDATVDSSHPSDLGMVAYADAYEAALRPILEQW